MLIKCTSIKALVDDIKDKRLVLFGAGVIGQITVPEILRINDIIDKVDCFIDNDKTKWGKCITLSKKEYEIKSPQYLNECESNTVILINISRYYDVIEQLEQMKCTVNMVAYIMPMMCIHNYCSTLSNGNPVLSKKQLIPKKIHYMWIGRKPIPDNLRRCIDTWYKLCPDYEIIEWNENNYNIEKHVYMKQAYEAEAYGFVPDYARIDILYNEGGIYMDTDVELKKNLNPLLYQEAFCGVEKWQVVNLGGCCGSIKGHQMLKRLLDNRAGVKFVNADGSINRNTCGFYDTKTVIASGYKIDGSTQNVYGMNIYAYDYFHPYDYMSGICNITEHTYSVHHFNGGWLDKYSKEQNMITSQNYLNLYKECLRRQEVKNVTI